MSFIVLALPRSRSFWLSKFLSYPPYKCSHDLILQSDSLKHLITNLSSVTGSVELGLGLAWPLLLNLLPETKIVVIRRDLNDVYRSLHRLGLYIPVEELEMRDKALEQCSQHPKVKSYSFEDLGNPECCKEIFEYCLNCEWDETWYRAYAGTNIQLDVPKRMQLNMERLAVINKIIAEAVSIDPSLEEFYAGQVPTRED